MYQGFQYAPNETVTATYVGTISNDDFEDAFIDKLNTDIGLVCYKKVSESSGSYSIASVYYVPVYSEDGAYTGYETFEEGD